MNTGQAIQDIKERIMEMIPEFGLISDAELRENAVLVWEDAVTEGGWTLEEIQKMPFSVHVKDCKLTFIEHVRTVCRMCVAVSGVLEESYGDRMPVNRDHLVAGALLADVGKLLEYEQSGNGIVQSTHGQRLRHTFIGVAMSHKRNIPAEVQHVIATHSKEGEMMVRSNESVIFHHADFIDFDLVSKKRPF